MYKIYINQTAIQLAHSDEVTGLRPSKAHLVSRYAGNSNSLLNYIDMAEKSSQANKVTLYSDDEDQLIKDFFSLFKIVEAAGGLVYNDKKEILMIFRRGHWDLPKGKIDPGETPDQAAIREVEEETGLQKLQLGPLLHTSYHSYRDHKNRRILKPTFWYRMHTIDQALTPQTEEDIEQAVWIRKKDFLKSERLAYASIWDVLKA